MEYWKKRLKEKKKKKIVQQVLFCIKYFIKQLHDWRREKKKKEKKEITFKVNNIHNKY